MVSLHGVAMQRPVDGFRRLWRNYNLSVSQVSYVVKQLPVQHVVHNFKPFTVFEEFLDKRTGKVHLTRRGFVFSKDSYHTLNFTL